MRKSTTFNKKTFINYVLILTLLFLHCINATGFTGPILNDSSKLKINGQWFLAYQYGESNNNTINQFTLKRGYITFKQTLNNRFSVRFTQDITLDEEGEDAGNIELRLKYCYLNLNLDNWGILHDPKFEFGLVHRPWLDFEEHINRYRVQGKMFLERNKLFNSADFGVTFVGLLGGKMSKEYQKNVSSSYPGKYGSIVLGVYNGCGYHAFEKNQNKTIEGRFTLRPFPSSLPGLQFSYTNIIGKANNTSGSDFIVNTFFVSSESKLHTLTAQYYKGKGDFMGKYTDTLNVSYSNKGYSVFGELKTFQSKLCIFSRFDQFYSSQETEFRKQSFILGLSSYFYKKNKVVFDVDFSENNKTKNIDKFYELAIEIQF